jgi:hypothetical protein
LLNWDSDLSGKRFKDIQKGPACFHVGNGHYWSIQMVDRKNNRFSLVRESEDGFKTFKMTSASKNLIHEKEHKAMKERAYQSALKKNHELKDCIAVGKAVEAKTVHSSRSLLVSMCITRRKRKTSLFISLIEMGITWSIAV